jgi:hypothetical protein
MNSNLMKLAALAGVLYAAYRYGPAEAKGMVLGVAGVVLLNQIPMARDAAQVRLVA